MTCPHCRCADGAEQRQRIAELEADNAAKAEQLRRCRERVAVLIGRVAAVSDMLDAEAERRKAEGADG